ncbi:hypothetical protein CW731_14685 [Polaribacter sp. ALD11]|uniref:DUF5723 family protein n=1 Tax=Polaribacter sp. ALD11 TaxID=2058137 RepID=UPI000C316E8F|nr:DUF5723 family protein [Polaribacter sp. ALD11]AUC86449.1 hypothetical protein CW731_14685 [Polaribacter sp. ALD11]
MRKIGLILFLGSMFNVFSQNKQVLYDFAGLPQTLLLNPGLETNYKYHVGLPLLSGFSLEFGTTGFAVSDIFAVDNRTITDKINTALQNIDSRDYLKIYSQIEVFSVGYRFDEKTYLSLGFYHEVDGISYLPKDIITLANEGNTTYLNKNFSLSQLLYKVDVLGVIHAGITRKVNEKLTIGGRFKIYSSALNLESTNNSGTFTTNLGDNNTYIHHLDDINVDFKTSGLIENNEYINDPSIFLKNTFLGGNLGLGIDFGLTYSISPQLQFSGSLLDIGFVNHKKNIKNTITEGSFTFEGIEFEYDANNSSYWEELDAAFKEQLPTIENQESYISWRPAKLNAAIKYSFGNKRSKYCYDSTYKDFYTDAFGAQLYSVFRPLRQQFAITGFYEKSFSNKLHAKLTYTIDDYSYYNLGVGVSAQIWKINFYGILDNIMEMSDISSSNNVSLQFGFNLLFN